MSPVALREAQADGVALPLARLLVRAQLQRPVVARDRLLDRLPRCRRVEWPSTKISSVPLPITGVRAMRRRDVAGLVARRHDHADAGRAARGRRACRARAARRSGTATACCMPGARTRYRFSAADTPGTSQRQHQAVLVAHHLQARDVEQVRVVGVRQPVRRRRRALPARHLRQPRGQLPQVIERGQVDAPAGRELALEAGQQRLDVQHAVAQPIADRPRPRSHDAAEPDARRPPPRSRRRPRS